MFEQLDLSSETIKIFDAKYLEFVYPGILDLSYNLYKNVCQKIGENRKSLVSFQNGYFRDQETEMNITPE